MQLAVRYGATEELYGHAAIAGFRASREASSARRRLLRTVVTAFGRDFATTCCEFERLEPRRRGRQTQAWIRTADGWRIAAAHVSLVSDGGER
ncbi:MAG: AtzH-like domain-containing protein [Betaproteobacteria bacterium]